MQLPWRLNGRSAACRSFAAPCINHARLCTVLPLKLGSSRTIIAYARRSRSSATEEPSDAAGAGVDAPISRSQLQTWTKPQLADALTELGLASSGNKPDLIERLADALWGQESEGAAPAGASAAGDAQQQEQLKEGEAQTAAEGLLNEEELYQELRAELAALPYAELVAGLQERGLSASGSTMTLLDRLTEAMLEEFDPEELQAELQASMEAPAGTSTAAGAPDSFPAAPAMNPEEREYLLADRQQKLLEELAAVDTAELLGVLSQAGEQLNGNETREELVERTSWLLAEEEVAMMEAGTAAGPASTTGPAAGAAGSAEASGIEEWRSRYLPSANKQAAGLGDPSSILSSLTTRTISSMKKTELQQVLSSLSLSTEGSGIDLRERLRTILAVHQAAVAGNSVDVVKQLSSMTIRELRSQLDRRGLPTSGAKGDLEARLARAMTADMTGEMEEGQAAAEEPAAIGIYDADGQAPSQDPPMTLAVICGGTSPLQRETSLASARTLIDAMHTAPLAAPPQAGEGGEGGAADMPGVKVDVYVVQGGAVYSVPPAFILSLSQADLDAQLPALGHPLQSLSTLASHLRSSQRPTVALSLLPTGDSSAQQLATALQQAGLVYAGAAAEALAAVADRGAALQKLQSVGYPVLPMHRVDAQEWARAGTEAEQAAASTANGSDAEAVTLQQQGQQGQGQQEEEEGPMTGAGAVVAGRIAEWCRQQGWDPELQLLAVAPADAPSGECALFAKGARRAARRVEEYMAGGQHGAVLVEPYAATSMVAWNVVVVESEEDGPVALMPTQVEVYDTELEMFKHKLEVAEHELMQDGTPPEELAAQMQALAAVEPDSDYASVTSLPRPLAHRTLRFMSPPEMSLAMTQTLRHAAAKAYAELGLQGTARFSGWVALDPNWRQRFKRSDEFVEPLPDMDAGVLQTVAQQMEADAALLPLPLSDYYDSSVHMADLSAFNAAQRLSGAANGEGTVYVAGVEALAPLHACSIAQQQASEVGLSPGALVRHTVNMALARAGHELRLPPQPPADMRPSVLWAHVTGVTEAENAEGPPPLYEQGKMEPVVDYPDVTLEQLGMDLSKPMEELVAEIIDVTAPVPWDLQEHAPPEEWEPEFDPRTQDDINAERDATLSPERLAWREGKETWVQLDRHGGDLELQLEVEAGRLPPALLGQASAAVTEALQHMEEQDAAKPEAGHEEDEGAIAQPPPHKPRVWVLMGGEGDERQASLRSGVNVWTKLQRFSDLQAEPFLLPPVGAAATEIARRAALLQRRTEWLCNGLPEEDIPEELTLEHIRNMDTPPTPFLRQLVYALPPSALNRHSVEEAVEAAERLVARASVSYLGLPPDVRQQVDVQLEVQQELAAHFVQGVGGTWGGRPDVLPAPPRVMDLGTFIDEAAACGATVFVALHNSPDAQGALQEVLGAARVAYTGPGREAAMLCASKVSLAEALADLEESGISSPPRRLMDTAQLLDRTDWASNAEALWQQLVGEWGEGGGVSALALKPPEGGSGIGVAKICNARDLALYAAALQQGATAIPAGMLSGHRSMLYMPPVAPPEILVEPWVDTDPVLVAGTAGDGNTDGAVEVTWAGEVRWVEAVIGLLGNVGTMQAMTPSLVARSAAGERCHLTPPPASVLPAEAVASAQQRAVLLAGRLGLRGLAQVDCFVNVDTGELIVLDVRSSPKLSDGHPLLQQALLQSPPLLPHELFREQLLLAQQAHESDVAAAKAGLGSQSAWYDGADGWEEGAGDFDLAPVGAGMEDAYAL